MPHLTDIPSSVYRIQLNENFSLKDAIAIIPYLNQIGCEGIYCSPIFESASLNGYDVTDPNRIKPGIGSMEQFNELCQLLQQWGMKLVIDVIPNHMGIKGISNKWWLDVMEKGQVSSFACFFDINWSSEIPSLVGKVLLPILNNSYEEELNNQKIKIKWDGGLWCVYGEYQLPLAFETYLLVLGQEKELRDFAFLKNKQQMDAIYHSSELVHHRVDSLIQALNEKKGLHPILEQQHYRLAHWKLAGKEINYRRFFNINELVALHIEDERVLNEHHRWVFELIETQKVQGLRIDHPDGLYNPTEYFDRIQAKKPPLVVVEKVLGFKEPLPEKWKVSGTVGYEFLNCLNGLFVNKKHEEKFTQIYERFIGHSSVYDEILYERKKCFIKLNMTSEIHLLSSKLDPKSFARSDLNRVLEELLACFPVYRTYISPGEEVGNLDKACILKVFEMAKTKTPEMDASLYEFIKDLFLSETGRSPDFIIRFQQLTAPVHAKGLEDSVYYIFNRLISLNEVGGNPQYFGHSKSEFHQHNKEKLAKWPLGFLMTSSHDTKYSEDVRMRVNVLSEIPDRWLKIVLTWQKENEQYKTLINGVSFPEPNTEYYIYQMLVGIWPDHGRETSSPTLRDRLHQSLLKVVREAGIYTSWMFPNEQYEKAALNFLTQILSAQDFLASFIAFQQEIAFFGRLNSLSSLVLKVGSCGIVDVYQGNQDWHYCLMDPDNRRVVSYDAPVKENKAWFTARALKFRRQHKKLFLEGEYMVVPQTTENVIAFLRKFEDQIAIVIGGCFFTEICSNTKEMPCGEKYWKDGGIVLPKKLQMSQLVDIFTGKTHKIHRRDNQAVLDLSEVFHEYPCAILTDEGSYSKVFNVSAL